MTRYRSGAGTMDERFEFEGSRTTIADGLSSATPLLDYQFAFLRPGVLRIVRRWYLRKFDYSHLHD